MSKRSVSLSASEISSNWNTNMKSSVSKIQAGIDRVSVNPCEEAANAQDKMLTNLQASVNDGTWASRLRSVSKEDWKTKTKSKVGTNLASGVDNAMTKRQKFDTALVSKLNEVLPTIADMPSMTIDDSVNRATTYMRKMHEWSYKKSS